MFCVLDPEVLFRLRLERPAGTGGGTGACRVIGWSGDSPVGRPQLTILDESSGRTALLGPGSAAWADVTVLLGADEAARLGKPSIKLKDYPAHVCNLLLEEWPAANRQGEIMGVLLEPFQTAAAKIPWLVDARRWLRLGALRESAPLDQSTEEFFAELKRGLEKDKRVWSGPAPPAPPPVEYRIPVKRLAKPISALIEIHKAHAAGRSAAAASRDGKSCFVPYLEEALKNHWIGVVREGNLLPELFAAGSAGETAIEVRVATAKPGGSVDEATVRFGRQRDEAPESMTITLAFNARPELTDERQAYEVRLNVALPPLERRTHPPSAATAKALGLHLNDLAWALDCFFVEHAMTARASERLIFRDVQHLQHWIRGQAEARETRLQLLAQSWQTAGAPLVGKDLSDHDLLKVLADALLKYV